jgi:hypothetical protein
MLDPDPDPHTGTVVMCEMSILEEHFISNTVWMVRSFLQLSQNTFFFHCCGLHVLRFDKKLSESRSKTSPRYFPHCQTDIL